MRPGESPGASVASEQRDGPAPTAATVADSHVVCYVRSTVPGPVVPTVDAVVGRLERLAEAGLIGSVEVTHWPPERHAVLAGDGTTREELVDAFECWAAECGCSLEPAFSRRERPTSPYGASGEVGTDGGENTLERVRVPLVALAIYDERVAGDANGLEQHHPDAVRGVVPYTEPQERGDDWTCTVDEWLATLEPSGRASAAGGAGDASSPVESWQ
ncbi:HTH domain-containing protein [Natrarchaeobaculum aegyptiacum]|uniref:Uncharacterized protein n=1 Tax=Natrarchaeobaculum aegyptiacum TaxID=745377 RepID=A0A2Z2HU45_9EURY|nr:HTH domain-containing protein [Natrarchaeobaculum aegyptiacum]ARS89655.1 hypothetical protein B1756_07825 [Natrarchaeobaculum aegyptiacum]